jgi:hypothetical protein
MFFVGTPCSRKLGRLSESVCCHGVLVLMGLIPVRVTEPSGWIIASQGGIFDKSFFSQAHDGVILEKGFPGHVVQHCDQQPPVAVHSVGGQKALPVPGEVDRGIGDDKRWIGEIEADMLVIAGHAARLLEMAEFVDDRTVQTASSPAGALFSPSIP